MTGRESLISALPLRYMAVLGCGHSGRGTNLSTRPPTTAAVAYCGACDRHVPVYVETLHIDGCTLKGDHRGACDA